MNGVRHCGDGPAVVSLKTGEHEWWYHGRKLMWIARNGIFALQHLLEFTEDEQDFIIRLRPDLITKIGKLHPSIEAKYKHELDLSKVDV